MIADSQAERMDLDFASLAVIGRVLRASKLFDSETRDKIGPLGAEIWEFDVLVALRRVGPPYRLTAGALLSSVMVSNGALTNRVDRLVAKGLVSREVDPDNRRQVLITLTDDGHQLTEVLVEAMLDRQRTLLAGLSRTEQDELAALLRKLLVSLGDTSQAQKLPRHRQYQRAEGAG